MEHYENGLFIFRRDLRIEDNMALNYAAKHCNNVYTLFNFTPEQVVNNVFKSNNAIHFMIESLKSLQSSISDKGGKLIMKLSKSEESVYRQYYKSLESLNREIEAEMTKYENGVRMSGVSVLSGAADVMRYAAQAELVTDWIEEEEN